MILFAYLAVVVLVNLGFTYVPMIHTPIGLLSPMAAVVGIIFVLRDYAQRNHGQYVLPVMLTALALSYFLADPHVAIASALSFGLSEFVDWLIFTVTKKPFGQRVLVSTAVAAPVDTIVFLSMVEAFTTGTFVLMLLSKLVASFVVFVYYQRKDDHNANPKS